MTALSTAKLAFAALFFGAQALLVVRSHASGDPRFGYRMFAETTFFRMRLFRVVDGELVHAPTGYWTTASGERVSWSSDVRDFRMSPLEREMRAKIGLVTTLAVAQHALDWKIDRLPESDRETTRLVLEVDWRKADGEKGTTRLESKARARP